MLNLELAHPIVAILKRQPVFLQSHPEDLRTKLVNPTRFYMVLPSMKSDVWTP